MPKRNTVEVIIKGIDKASGPIKVVGSALAGLGGIATTAAGTFAGNLLTGAVDQLQNLGMAAIGVGAEALQMGKDFEFAMASMSAAAKSDISEGVTSLEELHDAAIAVGGDTRLLGVSATGAADSIIGLYKAGLNAADIFGDLNGYMNEGAQLGGVLRASIDLAAASELDMVQASDLAATTLATFGLTAEEIGPAMDNFVKAADASVAEVEDLAAAMVNVGPTMAAFGIPLEDVNNALAVLSTRGIAGSEAGTALKSMFTNMMRPTDQVKDSLAALNVSLYDSEGAMRTMPDIIGQFQQALFGANEVMVETGGRTKAQQDALDRLAKMYGKTKQSLADYEAGIKGAGMTEKARAKKIADLLKQLSALEGQMGPLNAIQGTMTKSTRELTEAQRNQYIQTIFGTFGMKAANTLLAEGVEGWDAMAAATEAATGTQEQAASKAATLAGMMEALEGTIETVKIQIGEALIPVAKELVTWFSEMVDQYGPALVEWIGAAIPAAIQTLAAFWTSTLLPAIQIVGAYIQTVVIPILAQVVGWVRDNLPTALQLASEYWTNVLLPAIQTAIGYFQTNVVPVIQMAVQAFTALSQWVIANMPMIQETFMMVWTTIQNALTMVAGDTVPFVLMLFQQVADWFTENMPLIQETVETVLTAIQEFWTAHGEQIMNALTVTWEAIKLIISEALNIILTTFTLIMQLITGDWQGAWTSIQEILMSILTIIVAAITASLEIIAAYIGTTLAEIQATWTANFENLKTITTTILENIRAIIGNFSLRDVGAKLIDGLKEGIKSAAGAVADAAARVVRDAIQAAKNALGIQSPSRVFEEIGVNLNQGFAQGIRGSSTEPAMAATESANNVTYYFNQTVNTRATQANVMRDFALAEAMAG
jgi:TP901 family phage tail tape measure protein